MPGQAGPVTLDQYLHAGAQRLGGLSQKEQNKLICKMINAVENYASKKRVVPNSENGKLSLNYGYEAIKAVAASPEAEEKFLRPLEANITRLQESMLRKGLIAENRMIRLPVQDGPEDAQAGQNNAPAHQGRQQIGMPGNN